ncbi:MAG: galactose-1-phosphate uridylyltransferase [Myxococcales bacterium]|nr:galactose-1-phosphate uridylyltransferase [Myxococcales bacterium]
MHELRKDPITGRWVIISDERAKRPLGLSLEPEPPQLEVDPFAPGNEHLTPPDILTYRDDSQPERPWIMRVIPNKFPALRVEGELTREGVGLYDKMSGIGAHEVIIETRDGRRDFAAFNEHEIELVMRAYRDRIRDLQNDVRLKYILIFKNEGRLAGATQQHSHSQLIALPIIPKNVQEELQGARDYYEFKERNVYLDIINQELRYGERLVTENPDFIVVAPFASRVPFELTILPRNHQPSYQDIRDDQLTFLAKIFSRTMRLLAKALGNFSYNFAIHTAPLQVGFLSYYHWHIEIAPRLTRFGGFEAASGFFINPTPPEEVAQYLRNIKL